MTEDEKHPISASSISQQSVPSVVVSGSSFSSDIVSSQKQAYVQMIHSLISRSQSGECLSAYQPIREDQVLVNTLWEILDTAGSDRSPDKDAVLLLMANKLILFSLTDSLCVQQCVERTIECVMRPMVLPMMFQCTVEYSLKHERAQLPRTFFALMRQHWTRDETARWLHAVLLRFNTLLRQRTYQAVQTELRTGSRSVEHRPWLLCLQFIRCVRFEVSIPNHWSLDFTSCPWFTELPAYEDLWRQLGAMMNRMDQNAGAEVSCKNLCDYYWLFPLEHRWTLLRKYHRSQRRGHSHAASEEFAHEMMPEAGGGGSAEDLDLHRMLLLAQQRGQEMVIHEEQDEMDDDDEDDDDDDYDPDEDDDDIEMDDEEDTVDTNEQKREEEEEHKVQMATAIDTTPPDAAVAITIHSSISPIVSDSTTPPQPPAVATRYVITPPIPSSTPPISVTSEQEEKQVPPRSFPEVLENELQRMQASIHLPNIEHEALINSATFPQVFAQTHNWLQRITQFLAHSQLSEEQKQQHHASVTQQTHIIPVPNLSLLRVEPNYNYWFLERSNLIASVLNNVSEYQEQPRLLRLPLRVKFTHEEQANDQGGVKRESFELFASQLFSAQLPLWEHDPLNNTYWPLRSQESLDCDSIEVIENIWRRAGLAYGLALFHGQRVPFAMPAALFCHHVNIGSNTDVSFVELERIFIASFPSVVQMLHKMRRFTDDEWQAADLNFEYSYSASMTLEDHTQPSWHTLPLTKRLSKSIQDITLGGSKNVIDNTVRALNRESFDDYYQAVVRFHCERHRNIRQFVEGVVQILNRSMFKLFDENEFREYFCTAPVIRVTDLHNVIKFRDFDRNRADHMEYQQWFWQTLNAWNSEQLGRFMAFITSSRSLPTQIVVYLHHRSEHAFLSAHTCFNSLILPWYPNRAILQQKMLAALEHIEGFGLE